jgi:hypothetical protein
VIDEAGAIQVSTLGSCADSIWVVESCRSWLQVLEISGGFNGEIYLAELRTAPASAPAAGSLYSGGEDA